MNAQSLLNLNDSSRLEQYAETGVSSVTVKTTLFTNGKPDYPNTKLRLTLNPQGLTDTFVHHAGSDIKYYKVFEYNDRQLITKESTLRPDRSMARYTVSTYNTSNLLKTKITYDHQNTVLFQEFFQYNERAHLIHHLKIDKQKDTSDYHIKYRYDDQGRITLKSRQDERNQDIYNLYYAYSDSGRTTLVKTDHGLLGQIAVSKETLDRDGRVVHEQLYDQNGKLVTNHYYIFEKTNLVEERIIDIPGDTEFIISRKYNRRNRLIQETAKYIYETKPNYSYRIKYNCKGLAKKETIDPVGDKPQKIIKNYYDKQQNKVLEKHYQDGQILREVRYHISYFK